MPHRRHILFLTSTNLSSNPRCLKEVQLAISLGFNVSVLAFQQRNWTAENELKINKALTAVDFYYLDSSGQQVLPSAISVLFEKAGRFVSTLFPNLFFAGMGVSRRCWLLFGWCRSTSISPDLVIAHNPAAFYPAWWLAAKKNIRFALDVEDFHPGEGKDVAAKRVTAIVMKRLMPLALYNSFAAPLISTHSKKLFQQPPGNFVTVNNVFPAAEFIKRMDSKNNGEKIKYVWFSQFIDYGRGLEKILPVLDQQKEPIELTLIGEMREGFYTNEVKQRNYIRVIASLPQQSLHRQLGNYDIGLALEDAGSDLNRDICVTNKIWAYFQSGLYILASDTTAQVQFIQEHPAHGMCSSLAADQLQTAVEQLSAASQQVRQDYATRFEAAALYNWENESTLLKAKWETILQ